MALLVLKLLLVPLLLAALSWASSQLGPRRAGILTGLPAIAGPAALLIALEQGASFAVHAARATLAGELSLGVFCILYAWLCQRAHWLLSLAVALLGYAASTLSLQRHELSLLGSLMLALVTPALVLWLSPRPKEPACARAIGKLELGLRMLAGALLVLVLTGAAHAFGPRLSGLLTVFPIATGVLAVSAQRTGGAADAQHLLRGLAAGLYSLTVFFAVLALTLEPWGLALGFASATFAALLGQLAALFVASPRHVDPRVS